MTKYVIDLPDNVSFIVGKGYVLFNEKEFLRIPVKQLEKYSKKEDGEVEKDEEIVFDGRKEEQMSDKYVVSQEFIDELENSVAQGRFVSVGMLSDLPYIINNWRITRENKESNNRLIAIIRWVNGEDVFEVKPKKWVVRSKETYVGNEYLYFTLVPVGSTNQMVTITDLNSTTRFNTKEEAQSWANSHQEVVEVVE